MKECLDAVHIRGWNGFTDDITLHTKMVFHVEYCTGSRNEETLAAAPDVE